jgi:carbonic anhydrase/acetyltransferase-like protein (isoleucine patch superfamily)
MTEYPHKQKSPTIDKTAYIADTAKVMGDVTIGAESNIWFGTVIRGDVHEIVIGERTNIQDNSVVHVSYEFAGTYIGSDVTIGHGCIIHACTIMDRSFIGMGSIVMDKCLVEEHAMLAAGSLLTANKIVPSGELWGGRPAKFMRKLTDEDIEHFTWSAKHYVKLANTYK